MGGMPVDTVPSGLWARPPRMAVARDLQEIEKKNRQSEGSRLYVLFRNLLLFVFPIPCLKPFCVFVSVCQKIDFLVVFDIFLCQELTPTDSPKF